jgi:hypothetical protein
MNEFIPIASIATPTTYCGVERRAEWHTPEDCHKLLSVQEAMDGVNQRLDDGSARMTRIEESVTHVNDCIKSNNDAALVHRRKFEATLDKNTVATSEILEIVSALKGFIKVVKVIGKFVAWAAAIAAPIVAIWFTVKTGGK